MNIFFVMESAAVIDVPDPSLEEQELFRAVIIKNPDVLTEIAEGKVPQLFMGGRMYSAEEIKADQMSLFGSYAEATDEPSLEVVWRKNHLPRPFSRPLTFGRMMLSRAFAITRLAYLFGIEGYKPSSRGVSPWREFILDALETGILRQNLKFEDRKKAQLWGDYIRYAHIYKGIILGDIAEHGFYGADENRERLKLSWLAFEKASEVSVRKNIAVYKRSLLVLNNFIPDGRDKAWCIAEAQGLLEEYTDVHSSGHDSQKKDPLQLDEESMLEKRMAYAARPGTKKDVHTPESKLIRRLRERTAEAMELFTQQEVSEQDDDTAGEGMGSQAVPFNLEDISDRHLVDPLGSSSVGMTEARMDVSEENGSVKDQMIEDGVPSHGREDMEDGDDLFRDDDEKEPANEGAGPASEDTSHLRKKRRLIRPSSTSEEELAEDEIASARGEESEQDSEQDEEKIEGRLLSLTQNRAINKYIEQNLDALQKRMSALKTQGQSRTQMARVLEGELQTHFRAPFKFPSTGSAEKKLKKILSFEKGSPKKVGVFPQYLKDHFLSLRAQIAQWKSKFERENPGIKPRQLARILAEKVVSKNNLGIEVGPLQITNMVSFLRRCETEVTIQDVLNESPIELEELLRAFHAEHGETAQGFASLLKTQLEALAKTRFPPLETKFVTPKAARHFIDKKFEIFGLSYPQAKEEPSKMTLFLKDKKNNKDIQRIILKLAPSLEKSKGRNVVCQFQGEITALAGETCVFDGDPSAGHHRLTRLFERYIEKGQDGQFRLKEEE